MQTTIITNSYHICVFFASFQLTTKTFPTIHGPFAKVGILEFFTGEFRNESKYKHIPVKKSFGCPTSIQNPFSSIQNNCPSSAINGNTSFSILVGLTWKMKFFFLVKKKIDINHCGDSPTSLDKAVFNNYGRQYHQMSQKSFR